MTGATIVILKNKRVLIGKVRHSGYDVREFFAQARIESALGPGMLWRAYLDWRRDGMSPVGLGGEIRTNHDGGVSFDRDEVDLEATREIWRQHGSELGGELGEHFLGNSPRSKLALSINAHDRAICHTGGVCTTTRMNIRTGAKSGISESTTDSVESGARRISVRSIIGTTKPMASGVWNCWESCTELHIAPMPA